MTVRVKQTLSSLYLSLVTRPLSPKVLPVDAFADSSRPDLMAEFTSRGGREDTSSFNSGKSFRGVQFSPLVFGGR